MGLSAFEPVRPREQVIPWDHGPEGVLKLVDGHIFTDDVPPQLPNRVRTTTPCGHSNATLRSTHSDHVCETSPVIFKVRDDEARNDAIEGVVAKWQARGAYDDGSQPVAAGAKHFD